MPPEVTRPLREFAARAMSLVEGRARRSASRTQDNDALTFQPLAGDGSNRKVYRVRRDDSQAIAVSNPLPPDRTHPDENEGFLAVREYLQHRGVRVPAFYAGDLDKGFLLLEDLGDLRLYDFLQGQEWESQSEGINLPDLYKEALRALIQMQKPGSPTFRRETTSNPAYTEDFIVDQESGYFHRELVCTMAQRTDSYSRIEPECRQLAHTAISLAQGATAAPLVFMHRDFQSRNLMIVGPTLTVIDFQGARLGPAEYDLAALLYDPYVTIPDTARSHLVHFYVDEASRAGVPMVPGSPTGGEWPAWERRMLANAANRLMQALGAFAKLGGRYQRPDFLEHIPQGLHNLEMVLSQLGGCPRLLTLVKDLRASDYDPTK